MKLLLYSHFFAPSVGGTETIVLSIARGLAELRTSSGFSEFEVTLVTRTPAENFDDRLLPFQVVRQPNLVQLCRLIRSNDVIHVAGPAFSPLVLGLVMRKPVVIEHHGFQTICPTGQLFMERTGTPCPGHFMAGHHTECLRCRSDSNWLASWRLWSLTFVRRLLCARATANIAPTEWLSGLLHLPKTISIPHGLDAFTPRTQAPPPSHPPTIVFQGRLVSTKGIRVLLEAVGMLRSESRSFELVVVGDGPERGALEELAQRMEVASCVRFMGRLDTPELESVFAKASLVVVPSLGGEVFGLVVAENMSRALPIVASDLGAFTEVLGDTGFTFRNGDATDLARHLARLLDDSALGLSFGLRARQRLLQLYPLDRMIDAHACLYHQISATNRSYQRSVQA
jgi:glycosyltransferase involved in cell wall biosynthesis